ncbi:unnamed protein product [Ilex paraguariensis]|uniref:Uncharacterized protein n=1 Tax=Ilex paraguariensis TaxID=185542 RepID=A0ABC8UIA3_9AQUA
MSLSSAEKGSKTKTVCSGVTGELPEVTVTVEVEVEVDSEMTPFSTPCDSPLFFTPMASPRSVGIDNGDRKVLPVGRHAVVFLYFLMNLDFDVLLSLSVCMELSGEH